MLISVAGSSGLGEVAGIAGSSPAALLQIAARQPDHQVVVLAPAHGADTVRRQAELLRAARPAARVELVVSRHHALTLSLVAHEILAAGIITSVDDFVEAVHAGLTRARSLVWGPSVWRLRGTGCSLGTRLRCLTGRRDPVVELGSSVTGPAGDAWRLRPGDRVYGSRSTPALLLRQLGQHHPVLVTTGIDPTDPYARSAYPLTVVPADPTSSPSSHESEAA